MKNGDYFMYNGDEYCVLAVIHGETECGVVEYCVQETESWSLHRFKEGDNGKLIKVK